MIIHGPVNHNRRAVSPEPRCDFFRPCSICVKAGAQCISRPASDGNEAFENATNSHRTSVHRVERHRRIRKDTTNARKVRERRLGGHPRTSKQTNAHPSVRSRADDIQCDESLEAMDLEKDILETRLFALTGGVTSSASHNSPHNTTLTNPTNRSFAANLPWSHSKVSTASLLAHLPSRPVVDYLVAVYFNTVHWFMFIAHEGHFIHHYTAMLDSYQSNRHLISDTDEDFTFALLILTIVAMGGRYTSVHKARKRRCMQLSAGFQFDITEITSRILSVIRSNSTDSFACGTLSTIQVQLLLTSLYLYHGESNLAWANLGSIVRAAQALGLHKEHSEARWSSTYHEDMGLQERCQLKWRLFWAIHTADRFSAMCYGLPPLVSDDSCVAGIPREDTSYPLPSSSSFLMVEDDLQVADTPSVTILTYQTCKLKFYVILGQIISSLYRQHNTGLGNVVSGMAAPTCQGGTWPDDLVQKVRMLEKKVQNWYNELPRELHVSENMIYPACYAEDDDDDDDWIIIPSVDDAEQHLASVQERRRRVKNTVYGMQALLLQMAYDNALILIHRPILALQSSRQFTHHKAFFQRALDACWNASLRISNIDNHHVFHRNHHAHPVSYVGIHLFTAGIMLSAFASSAPLSQRSQQAKKGLSRVIRMQRRLKHKVLVSGQCLDILESLARGIMTKETEAVLGQDDEEECDHGSQERSFAFDMDCFSILPEPANDNASTHNPAAQDADPCPDDNGTLFWNSLLDFNVSALDIENFLSSSSTLLDMGDGIGFNQSNSRNNYQNEPWSSYDI